MHHCIRCFIRWVGIAIRTPVTGNLYPQSGSDRYRNDSSGNHLHDVFSVRNHGCNGRRFKRTGLFHCSDDCVYFGGLCVPFDLDLHDFPSRAYAVYFVYLLSDQLAGYRIGSLDLLFGRISKSEKKTDVSKFDYRLKLMKSSGFFHFGKFGIFYFLEKKI